MVPMGEDGEVSETSGFPFFWIFVLAFVVYSNILPAGMIIGLALWYAILIYLESSGFLKRWNLERVAGVILMIRTTRGRVFLEYISKNRKFWRIYGEFSIWLCFLVMFSVVALMVLAFVTSINSPPQGSLPATDILFIPGVTCLLYTSPSPRDY